MKKFWPLLLLSPLLFAEGPIYKFKDRSVNVEFQNVYQDLRNQTNKFIQNASSPTVTNQVFNVSSGSVTLFYPSTVTWINGYVQSNPLFRNIKDSTFSVVNGLGVNDDTQAFQHALDNLPDGGMLYIPAGTYKITSQLDIDTHNRITIFGDGLETTLNYTPAANNTRMFLIDGAMDNIRFDSFHVHQTNPTTRTGTAAFLVASNASRLTWNNVYFSNFSRYGLNLSSNVQYVDVTYCRFLQIRDTTSTVLAKAISMDGSNTVTIFETQFSENDKAIQSAGGTNVRIMNNDFEADGNSGNTLIDYTIQLTSVNELIFSGNYVEGEKQIIGSGYAFLICTNCKTPVIASNNFSGLDGVTQMTDTFIEFSGASTRSPIIRNNNFYEPNLYLVRSSVPFKLQENYYEDNGVELTTHTAIMNLISDPFQADLDKIVYMGYDPVVLSSGSLSITSDQFSVAGSSMNDRVEVYTPGYGLQGIQHSAYVNQNGNAVIVLNNNTGSAVNLSSGTWGVRIKKPSFN